MRTGSAILRSRLQGGCGEDALPLDRGGAHLAVAVAEAQVVRMPRLGRLAQQRRRDRPATAATQAHDPHARRPGRRRNRRNRLALGHGRSLFNADQSGLRRMGAD